jgi:hypothetical protein
MTANRLSGSLLAELYDREEDTYRVSLREAKHIGWSPPSIALRVVAAHADEALGELRALAYARDVSISSPRALIADAFRRFWDMAIDQVVDQERAYRRALGSMHEGIDVVRLTSTASRDEGDDALTKWCARWLAVRERIVLDVAGELAWFFHHERPPYGHPRITLPLTP